MNEDRQFTVPQVMQDMLDESREIQARLARRILQEQINRCAATSAGPGISISDEAVDAAAKAIFGQQYDPEEWELAVNGTRGRCRRDARAALGAAAPHLMSEAWDAGVSVGFDEGQGHIGKRTPNPYRKDTK